MSARSRLLAFALGAALVAAAACGDDTSPNPPVAGDAGADAADDDEEAPCPAEYPIYHDGISQKAGDLTVNLVSVAPAPPRQQTPNNWMLEVVGANGMPASGFTIENPDSYMPVHRHSGRTPPKVVVQTAPGRVQLAAIDFKMRGPWQVNFDVVPAGGKAIPTTLQVCVQ